MQSVIFGDRAQRKTAEKIVAIKGLKALISATGSPDVIKYIQSLPGVSTGAEGSSAIYVRGGNMGNNITTIDGVSLYGGSHLLGLTSAYSIETLSDATFRMGGFTADDNNLTASHIALQTLDGSYDKRSVKVQASNFLLGSSISTPLIKNKVAFIGSARFSPIMAEYALVKAIAGGPLDSLRRVRAVVYDIFGKATYRPADTQKLSLSLFSTKDSYGYIYGEDSDERMSWSNTVLNLTHMADFERGWTISDNMAYSRFSSRQGIVRTMGETENNLAIVNSLDEIYSQFKATRQYTPTSSLSVGSNTRLAWFNPGSSSTFKGGSIVALDSPRTRNISHNLIYSVFFQAEAEKKNKYHFRATTKADVNLSDSQRNGGWKARVNPEQSLLASINLFRWLSLEGTADYTVQHYHTLEGVPLGWSLDMMIPASSEFKPETAIQVYGGAVSSFGDHHLSIGEYRKWMNNLVYFIDASQIFSSAIAGWRDNIAVGKGTSRGYEFMYEKTGEVLSYKVAYTKSWTDRLFDDVNSGKRFPAKFDRRHILNTDMSVLVSDNDNRSIRATAQYTLQSGHWETVAAGEYEATFPFTGERITIDYFTSTNNYRMPNYTRLDLGVSIEFKRNRPQTLSFGIFNVTNKHNPFNITYDTKSREWRKISLLPIMPSVNYNIEF